MKEMMRVAVMNGRQDVSIEQRPIPTPGPGEVLIRIRTAGVCGSDLHYYAEGKIGDIPVQTPFVLGHEIAGTVVALGADVQGLREGQLVAVEPGIPCGKCEMCRSGHYNLCPEMRFLATPPYDGAFSEYLAYPAEWVFALPEGMNATQGALIEPLAVGFHAARQGGAQAGQTAVVTGSGCIGLVSMMALKAMGINRVYMVDVMEKRLEKALELGADGAINAAKEDVLAKIAELTDGRGVDLVIETAGTQVTTVQAIHMAKKGATIVLVGYSRTGELTLPVSLALDKELTFKTVFRYRHIYPMAIEAVAAGRINLKGIVTNCYDLDDVQQAMDDSVKNKADIVKAVVRIG